MLNFLKGRLTHVFRRYFFHDLIQKTANFSNVKWLGQPIWQNILDLWTIQETLFEIKPGLLIECGTYRGGSALFYAQLFDLLGQGQVVSIDVEKRHDLSHPRVSFLVGDSVSREMVGRVRQIAGSISGPIMAILDSAHDAHHVDKELESYAPLVTPNSYCLVQDGVIDTLECFRPARPGPLPAIEGFLERHPEFEVDQEKCQRFLISHHPKGWLKRKATSIYSPITMKGAQ